MFKEKEKENNGAKESFWMTGVHEKMSGREGLGTKHAGLFENICLKFDM